MKNYKLFKELGGQLIVLMNQIGDLIAAQLYPGQRTFTSAERARVKDVVFESLDDWERAQAKTVEPLQLTPV
jgi:hypothetical protein